MKMRNVTFFPVMFVLAVFLTAGLSAQPPDLPPGLTKPPPIDVLPAPGFAGGKTVFVDAVIGRDTPGCGRETRPCRTINFGITRARQLQDDPVAADQPGTASGDLEKLVTVQVGPGRFEEPVEITTDWLRLTGAGTGVTVITAGAEGTAVSIQGANPVWFEGFTFADSRTGMSTRESSVLVRNCQFVDIEQRGLSEVASFVSVESTSFSNAGRLTALRAGGGYLTLRDVAISGDGQGAGVAAIAAGVDIFSSCGGADPCPSPLPARITNLGTGIILFRQSTVLVRRVEITGNRNGIVSRSASQVGVESSVIGDHFLGLFLSQSSHATVSNTGVDGGDFGYFVEENSYLRTFGGSISNQAVTGAFFDAFSRAILDANTVFSGNGTDTDTDATSSFVIR